MGETPDAMTFAEWWQELTMLAHVQRCKRLLGDPDDHRDAWRAWKSPQEELDRLKEVKR